MLAQNLNIYTSSISNRYSEFFNVKLTCDSKIKTFLGLVIFEVGRKYLKDSWVTDGTGVEAFSVAMT